ncbi:MAG: hypothetical protein QXS75_00755 [Thermoplasmatales archaeon]
MAEEESIIESFIKAIEGTQSSAEFNFDNLTIKVSGNLAVVITGRVTITARPIHDRDKG